ncbi:carboxypeptidase A2, partial [Hyalella azteca]|uniref:Carboxypeptidase A2 n=1 Tax=Hyalella azteca TaxID=294128 RepID=A0A8B7NMV6_HYAAZ
FRAIDAQRSSLPASRSSRDIDSTTYRDYDTLLGELAQLEADFPNLVSSYEIGTTYEGRTLKVIAVSSGQVANAPVIWLDCGIHAREWVSHATCMYVLDQLTSGYGSDDVVNALLAAYDFHVLPITNPDGYVHSWDADRLWRKNRVPYGACFGADVNRNFDSNFGGEGASDLACADTYHGPSAFSEVESAAIRDSLIALGSRVKAVFTLHSYSQYWMFPYGYTTDRPADYDELNRVSALAVEALTAVHGTSYVYGNIADVIYVASGGSVDYTYETLGITYSFAVELRDQGQYGFLLPADQIIPTAEEFFAGFYTAIQNFQ